MSAILSHDALTLRAMGEDDLAAVMAIEQRAYLAPWTEGIFRDCLRVGYFCRLLEQQGEPQGYAVMSVGAGEAHILNLCVMPESQGKGLGRWLLEHVIGLAREQKADTVFLEVRPSNHAALGLYSSIGFNQVGSRRDYYPAKKGREDALILALVL